MEMKGKDQVRKAIEYQKKNSLKRVTKPLWKILHAVKKLQKSNPKAVRPLKIVRERNRKELKAMEGSEDAEDK
ncbi:hypothetical protein XENTR_v10014978 [Xenopus tropicalis]|nr:hypothetical protein XENTR_v10014978 [Xenopus tropicalis]